MIDDQNSSMMMQEPAYAGFFSPEIQPKIPPVVAKLADYITADNIADLLDEDKLGGCRRRLVG